MTRGKSKLVLKVIIVKGQVGTVVSGRYDALDQVVAPTKCKAQTMERHGNSSKPRSSYQNFLAVLLDTKEGLSGQVCMVPATEERSRPEPSRARKQDKQIQQLLHQYILTKCTRSSS